MSSQNVFKKHCEVLHVHSFTIQDIAFSLKSNGAARYKNNGAGQFVVMVQQHYFEMIKMQLPTYYN